MSYQSNQNFTVNGDVMTEFSLRKKSEAIAVRNSFGAQDFSTLATWVELDPLKHLMKLEPVWNKQGIEPTGLLQDSIKSDAVLKVNGEQGEFTYEMPVETDNCMKIVEDTSYQAIEGGVGQDGTPFIIILNRKLAPGSPISCDGVDGDNLIISDIYPVEDLGYGYKHFAVYAPSLSDPDVTYEPSLLKEGREYFEMGNAKLPEYGEKLSLVHMPAGTNYIKCKFKLGSGSGVETYSTGTANSVNLRPGETTVDTQAYINEIMGMGNYDVENDVIVGMYKDPTASNKEGYKFTVGSLLEHLAIKKYKQNMNRDLMFMQGASYTSSKGVLTYNEGLWRQMLRGFVHNYARKGAFNFSDLKIIRDYVFQANPSMDTKDSILRMKSGSNLYDNIEVLIQAEGARQVNNVGNLLGSSPLGNQQIITGALDNLNVNLVRYGQVRVPGIGMVENIRDTSLDYTGLTDRQLRGNNNTGNREHTSWSGIIWDVTDQSYSNNKKLPAGTKAVNDKVKANIYMVVPDGDALFWGHENGRYSSKGASDILASARTRHETFFMYGFGAMWVADPSKFVMTQVKKSNRRA